MLRAVLYRTVSDADQSPDPSPAREHVRVVAGLILDEELTRFLVTQRLGDDPGFADHWELPGGKADDGEDDREALRRELREELAVDARVGDAFAHIERVEPTRVLDFRVYVCALGDRPPVRVEVQDLRWVDLAQAELLTMPPLDCAVLDRIRADGLPGARP